MTALNATTDGFPKTPCINFGNDLDAPYEGAWGERITQQDINWIAQAGFRTLRLPVRFDAGWQGQIEPYLLARVDHIIKAAQAQGLTVILDLHHFDRLMHDPDAYESMFIAIWTELSEHFAHHEGALAFELLNEPRDAMTTQRAIALYDRVIPIIRANHPDRWIIVGGGMMNNIDEMLRMPVPDHHIALTFHYYDPFSFTHQQAEWLEEDLPPTDWGRPDEVAQIWRDIARVANIAPKVFLGEFGVIDAAPDEMRAAWTETVRRASEAHGISWCYWSYRAGFGIIDSKTNDWRPGMWQALMAP